MDQIAVEGERPQGKPLQLRLILPPLIQNFNVADQVADVFYTIEIRIRDFHGGEGLLHSAYLFKRQQVGECHDAPPIGPNALLRNQAIRSPVWRCFKIVRVLQ